MRRVAITFFELGVVKISCKNFNRKALLFFCLKIVLDCNNLTDAR